MIQQKCTFASFLSSMSINMHIYEMEWIPLLLHTTIAAIAHLQWFTTFCMGRSEGHKHTHTHTVLCAEFINSFITCEPSQSAHNVRYFIIVAELNILNFRFVTQRLCAEQKLQIWTHFVMHKRFVRFLIQVYVYASMCECLHKLNKSS